MMHTAPVQTAHAWTRTRWHCWCPGVRCSVVSFLPAVSILGALPCICADHTCPAKVTENSVFWPATGAPPPPDDAGPVVAVLMEVEADEEDWPQQQPLQLWPQQQEQEQQQGDGLQPAESAHEQQGDHAMEGTSGREAAAVEVSNSQTSQEEDVPASHQPSEPSKAGDEAGISTAHGSQQQKAQQQSAASAAAALQQLLSQAAAFQDDGCCLLLDGGSDAEHDDMCWEADEQPTSAPASQDQNQQQLQQELRKGNSSAEAASQQEQDWEHSDDGMSEQEPGQLAGAALAAEVLPLADESCMLVDDDGYSSEEEIDAGAACDDDDAGMYSPSGHRRRSSLSTAPGSLQAPASTSSTSGSLWDFGNADIIFDDLDDEAMMSDQDDIISGASGASGWAGRGSDASSRDSMLHLRRHRRKELTERMIRQALSSSSSKGRLDLKLLMAWLAGVVKEHAGPGCDSSALQAGAKGKKSRLGRQQGQQAAGGSSQGGGSSKVLTLPGILQLVACMDDASSSDRLAPGAAAAGEGIVDALPTSRGATEPAAGLFKGMQVTPQRVFMALLNMAHQSNTAAWAAHMQQQLSKAGSKAGSKDRQGAGAATTHTGWVPGRIIELQPDSSTGALVVSAAPL